jgi:hypothetical protein
MHYWRRLPKRPRPCLRQVGFLRILQKQSWLTPAEAEETLGPLMRLRSRSPCCGDALSYFWLCRLALHSVRFVHFTEGINESPTIPASHFVDVVGVVGIVQETGIWRRRPSEIGMMSRNSLTRQGPPKPPEEKTREFLFWNSQKYAYTCGSASYMEHFQPGREQSGIDRQHLSPSQDSNLILSYSMFKWLRKTIYYSYLLVIQVATMSRVESGVLLKTGHKFGNTSPVNGSFS